LKHAVAAGKLLLLGDGESRESRSVNRTSRIAIVIGIAAALSVGLLLALPKGVTLVRARLTAAWRSDLATASDEQVPAVIAELVSRDAAALPALIAGLRSGRKVVADESAAALQGLLARWEGLPAAEAAPRISRLARQLSGASAELPAAQRPAARQMAERILQRPFDPDSVDAGQVLADCEAVLQHCQASPPAAIDPHGIASAERNAVTEVVRPDIESVPPPDDALDSAGDESLPALVGRRHTTGLAEPALIDPPPERTLEPKRFLAPKAAPLSSAKPPADESYGSPQPEDRFGYLRSLSDVDVMQHLHTSDEARIAAATSELLRRGFTLVHLPLARAMTHADPAVRLKLVESLPLLRDIDPRPWLVHLSADPDANVRRAAQGILQTSQRPLDDRR
jgi:hypothetical protein